MKWLDDLEIKNVGEIVENPYTRQSCFLNEEAVAVYDAIKGAELLLSISYNKQSEQIFNEGLTYFRENWPTEYMILLD